MSNDISIKLPVRPRTLLSTGEFHCLCECTYAFICQQRRTTGKEVRDALNLTSNQWRDILFYLRHHHGVVSVQGKGIFKDRLALTRWLRSSSKTNH